MKKRITVNAGDRYGRLAIVEELPAQVYATGTNRYFLCQCDCGEMRKVSFSHLRSGHSRSCGCINATHRHTRKKPEHRVWMGMRMRCSSPSDPSYARYGGRGITVCERWQTYENFYADMGPRPSDSHTLDRIDNSKGYSPDNCRWATSMEQGANKRNNRWLTYKGRTLHLCAWARELEISATKLSRKIEAVGEQAAFDHFFTKLLTTDKVNP